MISHNNPIIPLSELTMQSRHKQREWHPIELLDLYIVVMNWPALRPYRYTWFVYWCDELRSKYEYIFYQIILKIQASTVFPSPLWKQVCLIYSSHFSSQLGVGGATGGLYELHSHPQFEKVIGLIDSILFVSDNAT